MPKLEKVLGVVHCLHHHPAMSAVETVTVISPVLRSMTAVRMFQCHSVVSQHNITILITCSLLSIHAYTKSSFHTTNSIAIQLLFIQPLPMEMLGEVEYHQI